MTDTTNNSPHLSLLEEQFEDAYSTQIEVGVELRSGSRVFGRVITLDLDSEYPAAQVGRLDGEQYVVLLEYVASLRVKTDPAKEQARARRPR